jgi:hypothetical protein
MPIRPIAVDHDNNLDTSEELLAISGPHFQLWVELKQANSLEPYLVDLHQKLLSHPDQHPHLKNREGLLLYKDRIVLSPSSSLRTALL